MIQDAILGATFAFAAAVQPGPFQAFIIARTMAGGWRRSWPIAFAPVLSDGPIIALVLLVLNALPGWLLPVLRLGGGAFLLYLARGALVSWRAGASAEQEIPGTAERTLPKAVLVNLLNPNPYLSWSLVMGPLLLEGWAESPTRGVALLVGFYGTFVVCLLGLIGLFSGARRLGPRISRTALLVAAVALAIFGCIMLVTGIKDLVTGPWSSSG
ncbi:MAG: LysE family transporter [bacterium]